jgi:segregation and condensation protein A
MSEKGTVEKDTRKLIAQPPLNLLFNPTIVDRKNIWKINVTVLLDMLLKIINDTENKDLRLCGIAVVSSAIIHRIKVESIFELEKIAMQHKSLESPKIKESVRELKPIEVPFRVKSTYPVSLEDLLHILENMISELTNPRQKKKQIELEAIQTFDFDQYILKLEEILREYQDKILKVLILNRSLFFRDLVIGMKPIEVVRCFIAVLYLAMTDKVIVEQLEETDDIRMTIKN